MGVTGAIDFISDRRVSIGAVTEFMLFRIGVFHVIRCVTVSVDCFEPYLSIKVAIQNHHCRTASSRSARRRTTS